MRSEIDEMAAIAGMNREEIQRLDKILEVRDAEIAALRAQLAATEERARKAEAERDEARVSWATSAAWAKAAMEGRDIVKPEEVSAFLTMKHGSDDAIGWLAAARADAVREFAKDLDDSSGLLNRGYYTEYAARYLSSLGVPSARPDAGRVERAKMEINCILHRLEVVARFGDADTIAVLEAADGAERGGR